MRWYYIFIKGVREQWRDYWILIMIVVMAPLFIGIYFLMSDTGEVSYDVILVNRDCGADVTGIEINLGDTLVTALQSMAGAEDFANLVYSKGSDRGSAIEQLKRGKADVLLVIPEDFSGSIIAHADHALSPPAQAMMELVGDVTSLQYIVGAIWTEETANALILEAAAIRLPVTWTETALGHSGDRSEFELYVPGLLILSIIMIIFSASAAIVREPETRTLERLKISRLTAVEFMGGISLVQIIIAFVSLVFALLAALALGYTLIPGTLGILFLIAFLTALSMISFSLIVAAMCRSIKEVAIIGTFPLFLLMFFTGAAFPVSGGRLFSVGDLDVMLNHLLSPTWAVDALNKVLVVGLEARDILPDLAAILVLSILYFFLGTWLFKLRHMRAG
ncbi:MAG: ABC transporter permease [Bacteroidota bacterium]